MDNPTLAKIKKPLFQLNRPVLKPVRSVCLATAPVIRTSLLTIFTACVLKKSNFDLVINCEQRGSGAHHFQGEFLRTL